MIRRITIIRTERRSNNINEQLKGFATSLGLLGERDKDKSCFRIFIELLKTKEEGMSSDELAEKTGLTRGTIVHHINMLMDRGMVIFERKKYHLREENLQDLVIDIRKELDKTLKELHEQARMLDEMLRM